MIYENGSQYDAMSNDIYSCRVQCLPEGLAFYSPGQRPGYRIFSHNVGGNDTQGVALGCRIQALRANKVP